MASYLGSTESERSRSPRRFLSIFNLISTNYVQRSKFYRYMENAKLVSQMMKTKPEMGNAKFVQWIEFAAANKNLHKVSTKGTKPGFLLIAEGKFKKKEFTKYPFQFLNLPGNDIGVLEYYCVDCILLLLFACSATSFLIWKTTSVFSRIIRREKISPGKPKAN